MLQIVHVLTGTTTWLVVSVFELCFCVINEYLWGCRENNVSVEGQFTESTNFTDF